MKKINKKQLYSYGKRYFTNEMTLKDISNKLDISEKKASDLMHELMDDKDFDMSSCIRTMAKKREKEAFTGKPPTPSPPNWIMKEEKAAFSNNEDDYGYSQWMKSDERYAYIEAGLKDDWYLEWITNLLLNLNKEQND